MKELAKLYSDNQIVGENHINGLLYGAELCGDFSAESEGRPAKMIYNNIILATHGSISYVIGRQEFKAERPAIRVIPSGSELNSVSYSGGFRGCIVKVSDELMMDIIRNNNPFPLESIYRLYDNKHNNVDITWDECDTLLSDMKNMIAAMGKKNHHFLHELNYAHLYILTSDIADMIWRRFGDGNPGHTIETSRSGVIFQQFLALLRENIDRQHSVTFYAGELCISKDQDHYMENHRQGTRGESSSDAEGYRTVHQRDSGPAVIPRPVHVRQILQKTFRGVASRLHEQDHQENEDGYLK